MSTRGQLFLVPCALDFGIAGGAEIDLQETIALGPLRIAARLAYWAAENAKTTRSFLKRVDAIVALAQPLQSINITELPRPAKGTRAAQPVDLRPLLAPALAGHDVGLISEAGLPAVADPGAALVAAAHAAGITVLPLSGPSSLLMALSASGLNGQSFAFVGYLPVDSAARAARIRELEGLSQRAQQTQLVIETPYRNAALMSALLTHLRPGSLVSVSCGLTTNRGWTKTASVAQWKASPVELPPDVPAVFCLLAA